MNTVVSDEGLHYEGKKGALFVKYPEMNNERHGRNSIK